MWRAFVIITTVTVITVSGIIALVGAAAEIDDSHRGVTESSKIVPLIMDEQETQTALGQLRKNLAVSKETGDVKEEAIALNKIGLLYARIGPVEKALDFHEAALEIQRKLGDAKGQITTLRNLAAAYELLGQYRRQLDCYQLALILAEKINDVTLTGLLLNNIGRANIKLGHEQDALENYKLAMDIQTKIGDMGGKARTTRDLAMLRKNWGQHPTALEICDKEIAEQEKRGIQSNLDQLLLAKALILKDLGAYEEAFSMSEKALGFVQENNSIEGSFETIAILADLSRLRGDSKKAIEICNKGLESSKKIIDRNAESNFLILKANLCLDEGQYSEAEQCLADAEVIKNSLGVPLDEVIHSKAEIALESGTGLESAEKSLMNYSLYDTMRRNFSLGRIALKRGQFEKAMHEFNGKRNSNPDARIVGDTGTGLCLESLNKPTEAQESFRDAIKVAEQIRDNLKALNRQCFFQVSTYGFTRITPYEGLCRVLQQQGKTLEAFGIAEMTKARAFADSIVAQATSRTFDVPENILHEDKELGDRFEALSSVSGGKSGNYVSEPGQDGLLEQLRKQRYQHIRKLRRMYPNYAAARYPEPMELNEIDIRPDEWALEYEVTDTGIVGFLLQGKVIKKSFFKAISRVELERLIRAFRAPLEVTDVDELESRLAAFDFGAGRKLADLLVGEILPELPEGKTVIVVPDESLGLIPFETLVLNDAGKISRSGSGRPATVGVDFFGDRNPVSYSQSLTALTLTRLQQPGKSKPVRIMAMTDPVFSVEDPHFARRQDNKTVSTSDGYTHEVRGFLMSIQDRLTFPRLEQTKHLGVFLRSLYPDDSDIYEGMDASKALLFSTDLTKYTTLAFATHGYAGCDLPGIREPLLALTLVDQSEGQDGFLRMSEVIGLNMKADIVTLTGCMTGVGKHVTGEGPMFMGRAFQTAGAASVLISLWNIAEKPSVELTENFLKFIHEGKSKLEALRSARRETRKNYDHPFFWASFILVGGDD